MAPAEPDKVVVTGAAGFIGSHLCERLIAEGFDVVGIDSFSPYYDVRIKKNNLAGIADHDRFSLVDRPLGELDLEELLEGASWVFHLAAQAGVRGSWHEQFEDYIDANIRATQRLCEAARSKPLKRFVVASSSSVYGETKQLPMRETHPTRPLSPYGVTKLSAESLCLLYGKNFGLPTLALRFFTVYGPRQRPDMAFHRFISRALDGEPIEVYGNGTQTRDFTYVSDVVDAAIHAMKYDGGHQVMNVGSGKRITLGGALDVLSEACRCDIHVVYKSPQKGDVTHTFADIELARRELGYAPSTDFREGVMREVDWVESIRGKLGVY